jgi:hypothetical protein
MLYSVGLLVASVAMETSQLWLLYVGFSIILGFGSGGIFMSIVLSTLLNFKAAGCGGLGGGLIGLVLGLWPAALSFAGPLLVNGLGTPNAFRFFAVVSFVLCAPPALLLRLPPKDASSGKVVNRKPKVNAVVSNQAPPGNVGATIVVAEGKQENNATNEGAVETERSSNVPVKLTRTDLLQQRKFWLVAIGVSCIMLPGFGIKLLIGPQMYAVYQSSQHSQDTASFMFLLAYGGMRLLTGVFADRFSVKRLFVTLGLLQVVTLGLLGACVFNNWPQVLTMALDTIVGLCLAGFKVLMQVWCVQLWGAANSGLGLGMVNIGFGVAAVLGSISAWWALTQLQMIDGQPLQGDQAELELAFAGWLWACSLITAVGVACITTVRVNDQQPVAPRTSDEKV